MYNEEYAYSYSNGLNNFIIRSLMWMGIGLFITAITAYVASFTRLGLLLTTNFIGLMLVIGAEIAICIFMSKALYEANVTTVATLFFAYCALTGITFSTLGLIYGVGTLYLAFLYTAGLFGCMAVIGMTTKMNMANFGPILLSGIIVMLLCTIINMFLRIPAFDTMICWGGIGIFMIYIMFDIQNLKKSYQRYGNNYQMLRAIGIYGAFQLYLDFINLFIRIVRVLGNRNRRN